MGIDPDAYMAGAIPSLSRGGSWRQDDHLHSDQSVTSYNHAPGGAIFPRPSQIVPQPAPPMVMGGNRSNAHFAVHHPWAVRPPFAAPHTAAAPQTLRPPTPGWALTGPGMAVTQSKAGGGGGSVVSGKPSSVGPTKHPGWANLHTGGYRSSPTSPTAPSGANFIASQAASQYGVKPQSHGAAPLVSPRFVEPIWEYDSGSPKPMTAEPDYFSLPVSPLVATPPHTPTGGAQHDSLPPPPKPAPHSPRPRLDSGKPLRPALSRRHTHDRYSPEVVAAIERAERAGKVDSKSLGRVRARSGLRKPTFDIASEAGESYYAPSTKAYAHSIDPPSSSGTGKTAGEPRSRPRTSRRSTVGTPQTVSLTSGSSQSFAEKRFKNRSHPALSTIASTVDFTQTAPTTPTIKGRDDRSQPSLHSVRGTSTVDFTQTAPNSPLSRKGQSQHPSMDLQSLHDALPRIDQAMPTAPLTASPIQSGYVPPNTDDGYDRYTAHPAAPVPPRVDVPTAAGPAAAEPPKGAGLKHVTADTYRPPGLPKPLKDIGWNRDGPAMRTYGIAWLREGTAEALPGKPAGPRWIQARPPASAAQSGGSWWESGAA